MSLRISTEPKTLSEEEKDAELAEGRKNTAEAEFVDLANNKKKLSQELSDIQEQIKSDKETLLKGKDEIHILNEEILKIKSSLSKEIQALSVVYGDIKSAEEGLVDFKFTANEEKLMLQDELLAIKKQGDKLKSSFAEEIVKLEDSKKDIENKIKKITVDWNNLTGQKEAESKKVLNLQLENENLLEEKKVLENSITSFKNVIEEQKGTINNNKDMIVNLNKTIIEKEIEIKTLDSSIEKKKEELKSLEKQAFTILGKEDILFQKEQFIKSQYERAGIKWEE